MQNLSAMLGGRHAHGQTRGYISSAHTRTGTVGRQSSVCSYFLGQPMPDLALGRSARTACTALSVTGQVLRGAGKIDLYVGKEVVRRAIPMEGACDELIELIKVLPWPCSSCGVRCLRPSWPLASHAARPSAPPARGRRCTALASGAAALPPV